DRDTREEADGACRRSGHCRSTDWGNGDRSITARRAVDLVANPTANAEAGLGARDVEVASAVRVADANVFHRLRLSDNDSVSSLSAGDGDDAAHRAQEKALDVHFLTSSQKFQNGSGSFC